MPQLFNDVKDFSSWFVIDDFYGTNDRIINIATKDEILDIIVKVNQIYFIYFLNFYIMQCTHNIPLNKIHIPNTVFAIFND